MFCKHDYKILSTKETLPPIEVLKKTNSTVHALSKTHVLQCMTKYAIIQIVVCTKCGKLKHFVDYNHPY